MTYLIGMLMYGKRWLRLHNMVIYILIYLDLQRLDSLIECFPGNHWGILEILSVNNKNNNKVDENLKFLLQIVSECLYI